jgi:hypothetical protein
LRWIFGYHRCSSSFVNIVRHMPRLEQILGAHRGILGNQFEPYKNHVYRVLNFCFALYPCAGDDEEKLIIAGCFHDLGIWPDDNVDYLSPSVALAHRFLDREGKAEWKPEIGMMIDLHHKVRSAASAKYPLVEVFRKGDWVDASLGLRAFGLPKAFIAEVKAAFPNLGFHQNLLRLTRQQFRRSPLHLFPMMKW